MVYLAVALLRHSMPDMVLLASDDRQWHKMVVPSRVFAMTETMTVGSAIVLSSRRAGCLSPLFLPPPPPIVCLSRLFSPTIAAAIWRCLCSSVHLPKI